MGNQLLAKMVRWIWVTILLSLLTACSFGVLVTDKQLVEKAIALQVNLSQQQVSQQLGKFNDAPHFQINRVVISEVAPLTIQDLPSFRLRGTYDLKVEFPKRQTTQKQNPFEVYLQQQQEGKTWRLLRPQVSGSGLIWFTYLIQ